MYSLLLWFMNKVFVMAISFSIANSTSRSPLSFLSPYPKLPTAPFLLLSTILPTLELKSPMTRS